MTKRLALLSLFSLALTSCAVNQPMQGKKTLSAKQIAIEAEADVKKGNVDKALASLRIAAQEHPTDKLPWLSVAQINFDQGKYGDAIVAALAVLERDAHDKLANSILAVSGLRLSTAAVTELVQKNNLTSDTKSEAQELAKLLRSNLGEEVLVPKTVVKTAARPSPNATARKAVHSSSRTDQNSGAGDPFGSLK